MFGASLSEIKPFVLICVFAQLGRIMCMCIYFCAGGEKGQEWV